MLRFLKPLSLTSHGAIALIIGLAFLFPTLSLVVGGVETEGVVVDFKSVPTGTWGSGGNQPVVNFYGPDGTPITFTSGARVKWGFGPSRGEQVTVIYDADDPSKLGNSMAPRKLAAPSALVLALALAKSIQCGRGP
ncbi:MAG: DUF3592 domain-containing protein [Proteobacteria bacterium]|nr:DUF3592 domain-containing protein [Pseudomonadota bacterium]